MLKKCEQCGKQGKTRHDVTFDEEMDMNVCGECSDKFADSVEEWEIRNRERIQREQEY